MIFRTAEGDSLTVIMGLVESKCDCLMSAFCVLLTTKSRSDRLSDTVLLLLSTTHVIDRFFGRNVTAVVSCILDLTTSVVVTGALIRDM